MAKLKVATIGAGSIAQGLHLPGYSANRYAQIVACVDPNPARWKEVRERFQVERFYRDYRELLEAERLDAVSICSPNKFHAEQALAAVRKGLHVLCEKPMTLDNTESARVVAAAKAAGRVFMVGFTHRFMRGNIKARDIIRSGALGMPFMLRIRFAHGGPYPQWAKSDWFYRKNLAGGGALLDMGIHAFDLARFFMGDIARVTASIKTIFKPIEVDDNAVLSFEFASGALGYVEVGWTSLPGFNGTEIYCRKGNIVIDYANGMRLITGEANPSGRHVIHEKKFPFRPTEGGWKEEIGYFIDCIRKGKRPEMGAVEGAEAVKISVAAYKSARIGRRVTL